MVDIADLTPPPTPRFTPEKVGPSRFEYEPPSSESPEEPASKDHLYESMRKRIEELEHENHKLAQVSDCFKKLFNPDSVDKLTGDKKRVNWSDKTITESVHTRFVCGATGYEHVRDKFPGAFPAISTMNDRLREMKVEPGIIEDSFKLIEIKARGLHAKQKYATLIMDEISLTELIEYDPSNKCLSGTITVPQASDKTTDYGMY